MNCSVDHAMPVIVGSEVASNALFKSAWISERLKHMARAFNERGTMVKKAIEEIPQSEESADETDEEDETKVTAGAVPIDLGEEWVTGKPVPSVKGSGPIVTMKLWLYRVKYSLFNVFEPQSIVYITWLFIVASVFIYNSIAIFYRATFPYEQESGTQMFFIVDLFCDLLYLLDMIHFKSRLMFVQNGEWIVDPVKTSKNYVRQSDFIYDLLALAPIDWALLYIGGIWPPAQRLSRVNRMFKIHSFWEFFARIDALLNSPYLLRIIHTMLYMFFIIHIGACVYYISSWYEGFGSTPWTYDLQGTAYLRCFYYSFRATTSIAGRLAKPENEFERAYTTAAWLLGVFVFAMVIGQIRDIISQATRDQDYYQQVLNNTAGYMRLLNLPKKLQKKVRFWLSFTWEYQKTFNENEILHVLPLKIRTDIALSVHYHTLSRVELFRGINRSVLRDLVLKLRPILFLPGEFICRKGETGHEMYIVNKGCIQVVGPDGTVFVTLSEGSVFGEIAILGIEGFTRRTADVRSNGYTQLFALSKSDLWDTLKNYPEYREVLNKKVKQILKKKKQESEPKKLPVVEEPKPEPSSESDEDDGLPVGGLSIKRVTNAVQVESIVKDRPRTPKLFNTVLEVIRPESTIRQHLQKSLSFGDSFDSNHQSSFDHLTTDANLLADKSLSTQTIGYRKA